MLFKLLMNILLGVALAWPVWTLWHWFMRRVLGREAQRRLRYVTPFVPTRPGEARTPSTLE